MKTTLSILIACLLLFTACGSSRQVSQASSPDDVYYSSKDKASSPKTNVNSSNSAPASPVDDQYSSANSNTAETSATNENDYSGSENRSSETDEETNYSSSGNTYITNNYYDDAYDYNYSSRIRRFHRNCYGWSYYDDYYTNMYWYDYNPYSWGTSIYLGYHWWGPSFYYTSTPFYYGYYGYYGYSNYGYGFNNGYWNGYQQGWNDANYSYNYQPYYYNSRDNNSVYVAPRGSAGANHKNIQQRDNNLLSNKYTLANNTVTETRPHVASEQVRNNAFNGKHVDEPVRANTSNPVKDNRENSFNGGLGTKSTDQSKGASSNTNRNDIFKNNDIRNIGGGHNQSSKGVTKSETERTHSFDRDQIKNANTRPAGRDDSRDNYQNSNQQRANTPIKIESRSKVDRNNSGGHSERQETQRQSRPSDQGGRKFSPSGSAPAPSRTVSPNNSGGSRSGSTGNGVRSSSRGR